MKRFAIILLIYGVILGLAMMFLGGCASPSALQAVVESALADGTVSPAEVDQINAALPPSFDWGQAVAVGGSILGSVLGIKILPNSLLRGPWDKSQPPQPPVQPV